MLRNIGLNGMRNSNSQSRKNNSLLGFSYRMTLISTTLTTIAPLITTLVDGLCTGNLLGTDAFNAINTVMPLVNAVSILTLICNMGGSVLAAKQIASGNGEKANRIFTISITSAVLVTLIVILAILSDLDGISRFLCPGESGSDYVRTYLSIYLLYFLFVPFNTTLSNFISVEGHPEIVTRSVIISNSVNVVLDLVFIAVFHWGIAGAAWSTVISGITNLALYVPHLVKGRSAYKFSRKAFGFYSGGDSGSKPQTRFRIQRCLYCHQFVCTVLQHIDFSLLGRFGTISVRTMHTA